MRIARARCARAIRLREDEPEHCPRGEAKASPSLVERATLLAHLPQRRVDDPLDAAAWSSALAIRGDQIE